MTSPRTNSLNSIEGYAWSVKGSRDEFEFNFSLRCSWQIMKRTRARPTSKSDSDNKRNHLIHSSQLPWDQKKLIRKKIDPTSHLCNEIELRTMNCYEKLKVLHQVLCCAWHREINWSRSALLLLAPTSDYNWNINQSRENVSHIARCDFLVVAFCSDLFSLSIWFNSNRADAN